MASRSRSRAWRSGAAPLLVPSGVAGRYSRSWSASARRRGRNSRRCFRRSRPARTGGEAFEELAVVGHVDVLVVFEPEHGVGERHLAVAMVVAVTLAVSGDVGELGFAGIGWIGRMEAAEQTAAEVLAGVEQAFKGDGTGAGAVVEEDGDGTAFVERNEVGVGGIDGGVGSLGPLDDRCFGGFGGAARSRSFALLRMTAFPYPADTGALVRGEDGELDAFLGEQVEDLAVGGGLGEPHSLGFAAEAGLEVGDAPANLGASVALIRQRHDDVVVDLGDGRSMAAVTMGAGQVGVEDHAIGAGRIVVQPAQQGWAEVEADAGVVVDDADDLILLVDDARGSVGGVALGGDAVVPVVVGSGGVLHLDGLEPGVLAGRLVEVAVDADETFRRLRGFGPASQLCTYLDFVLGIVSRRDSSTFIQCKGILNGQDRRCRKGRTTTIRFRGQGLSGARAARSQARHRYQLATLRQGAHFFARRSISAGLADPWG